MKATSLIAPVCLVLAAATAYAAGDPARGAKVFQACASCHSVKADEHMTGPSLAHVWNRKAGSQHFERYSDALARAGLTWNDTTLAKWLQQPQALVAGTTMTFPGLKEKRDRDDIIAYLRAVSEGKAPAAAGAMMGGGPTNLKRVGPNARVASLEHCRDTYIVNTQAGKTHKLWEFNLRLKTDSSANGPAPGQPVILPSGMQGDRASVVFASPAEISAFIKASCR
jgi:cytochrome c